LARLHKALSVPVRLEILGLLVGQPLCVNAITGLLRISQPAVSQHLAVLRRAGLVRGDKNGYMVHYSLDRVRLQEFRQAMAAFPDEPGAQSREKTGEDTAADLVSSVERRKNTPTMRRTNRRSGGYQS
jgi:DNA-binding transcriptional ArsR family regulator